MLSFPTRPIRRCKSGFTLVELLVVIGIVSVLLALLIPILHTVRGSAQTAGCAANLSSIGIAMKAFTMDNNDTLPTCVQAGQRADNWVFWQPGRNLDQSALAPYLKATGKNLKAVFTCPAQPIEDNVGFQNGGAYPLTYSINVSVSSYYPLHMPKIQNSTQKVLVYDENQFADDDQFWYGTDRDTLAGRHGVNTYQQQNLDGNGDTRVDRGLGNVLFVDGHVNLVDNNYCHLAQYNDLIQP